MTIKVFDSMGQEVSIGETILSFRGEKATILKVTRVRNSRRTGKVYVQWHEPERTGEYYDHVFDLKVVEV